MAETIKEIILNGKTLKLATKDADLLVSLAPEGTVNEAEAAIISRAIA
jgi:hypothetical protein